MAIALLGSLCHAPTVMLANFIATPIELRCCAFNTIHLLFFSISMVILLFLIPEDTIIRIFDANVW